MIMKFITKNIVILPFIAPLFLVIVLSIFNINKSVRVKLLTWTTPQISLGILMLSSSLSAAFLSASAVYAISNQSFVTSRKVYIQKDLKPKNENIYNYKEEIISDKNQSVEEYSNNYLIERDPREPSPTVTIPFRVINNFSNRDHELEHDTYQYEEKDLADLEPNNELYSKDSVNESDYIEEINSITNDEWGESISEDW